jgi:predicted Zn-dependent protease
VLLRVGVVQEKTGKATAEETFARARALMTDDVAFQQMRASVYLLFGMIERAEQDLQAALAAKPDDPITWYELASVFESRGEIPDAIRALERVDEYAAEAKLVELSAMARYRRGMLMQQAGYQQQSEPAGVATP